MSFSGLRGAGQPPVSQSAIPHPVNRRGDELPCPPRLASQLAYRRRPKRCPGSPRIQRNHWSAARVNGQLD